MQDAMKRVLACWWPCDSFSPMKQRYGCGEQQEGPVLQQYLQAACLVLVVVAVIGAARDVVVDCVRVDRVGGEDARQSQARNDPENRARIDQVTSDTRDDRGGHIAGMVVGLVAADAMSEHLPPNDPETDRGDRRGEDCVSYAGEHLRDSDRPECRNQRHRHGCDGHGEDAESDESPLPVHGIHKSAEGASCDGRGNSGNGQYNADAARIPVLAGHKEDGEKGSKPILDVAQEEIEPVERSAVGGDHLLPRGVSADGYHFLPFLFGPSWVPIMCFSGQAPIASASLPTALRCGAQ